MDDNTSNENDDESTTSKITAIKTSQTEFSGVDGQDQAAGGPGTIPENGGGKGNFTATSQQLRGEYSLCEGK